MSQLDFFNQAPGTPPRAHKPEDFISQRWRPPEGPPEYQAVYTMIQFVAYTRLNSWQQKVLWPWLSSVRDEMAGVTDHNQLRFMLGYVVGALEVEQLRNRTDAAAIAAKYGVVI